MSHAVDADPLDACADCTPSTPAVTLRVMASPLGGWIVIIDGWSAPPHMERAHPDIESAQRAADDILINYRPDDCQQCGCGEWLPIVGAEPTASQTVTSH